MALNQLRASLSPSRYRHILRTVALAERLAMTHRVPLRRARQAALFHDCGKFSSVADQRKALRHFQVVLDEGEEREPGLWHAPLGARLAQKKYGVHDRAVLQAIRRHTTGDRNMTKLDMVMYVADAVEENRRYRGVSGIRRLAFRSLEKSFQKILQLKMAYVLDRGKSVHLRSLAAWNWIRRKRRNSLT